jgi:hypothetical protein
MSGGKFVKAAHRAGQGKRTDLSAPPESVVQILPPAQPPAGFRFKNLVVCRLDGSPLHPFLKHIDKEIGLKQNLIASVSSASLLILRTPSIIQSYFFYNQ